MAQNPVPEQNDKALTLAHDMKDGLHSDGVAVGVKQNTEAAFDTDITAAENTEAIYQTALAAKTAPAQAQTIADSNGKSFIGSSKRNLVDYLGSTWSAAWAPVGYVDKSLAMPTTIEERQQLLKSMAAYYTANPTQENAAKNLTAAQALALFTALKDSRKAVADTTKDAANKKVTRDAAFDQLRNRERGLIGELGTLLADDDPLWHVFGLNAPADSEMADVPEGLILTPGAAGSLYSDWADARRASRYRVFIQVIGTDADFRYVDTVTDSNYLFTGLPSGATVKVRITAANDAGESQPGAEVQATVA